MKLLKLALIILLSTSYLTACTQQANKEKPSKQKDLSSSSKQTLNSLPVDKKPNILLIIVDDLGFTDLGSFGSEIATPNIDDLANKGMKLRNFYTAPTCSPTRAMLLTGVDNHLVGLGAMDEVLDRTTNLDNKIGYEGYLNDRAASLPEVLKAADYDTFMAGKWHLGFTEDNSPTARGFDKTFTLLNGGAGHFDELGMLHAKSLYRENGKLTNLPKDFYSSEFYTRKIQQYLADNKKTDKPFFAYVSYTAPHWPLQALPETIELYKGKYHQGYDTLHKQRIQAAIEAGVISPKSADDIPRAQWMTPWEQLSEDAKKYESRRMEIYAAMIHDLDVYIGQLIKTLKDQDQFNNTVIFFMSDNGAEGNNQYLTLKGIKSYIDNCCDNRLENLGKANSYIFAGPNWARASVGPSNLYKGAVTEGGIKAPAFILYPGMENPKSTSTRFVTVKDVMPTLLHLADVEQPQGTFNGRPILPIEGSSLLEEQDPETVSMGWELHGKKAIRYGYWKIISQGGLFGDGSWKLYNLKDDPSEQLDLASNNPEKLAEMLVRWEKYQQDNDIVKLQFKR